MSVERTPVSAARSATPAATRRTSELPSALDAIDGLAGGGRRLLVSLDYDGTLTPIVARPELAVLQTRTRNVVHELATLCPTAIVSGRDRMDVAERVAVS